MKILITGGAGFIGSHLAEKLLETGNEVYVIDNLSTGSLDNVEHLLSNPKFNLVIDTIMNEIVMDRLISECHQIYHLAAAVGVELIVKNLVEVIETNILGSDMVFKLSNRYLRKVLVTSTSEIYGKSENVPFGEEDDRILGATTKSRWCYSASKAIDEFLGLAYHKEKNLDMIIVRLFNTVGPRQSGQYGMVLPRFIQNALQNIPLDVYGDGSQVRCFTYVKDVVNAMVSLMSNPDATGQIFNIGSDEPISILELAKQIIGQSGSQSDINFVPYEEAYEVGFEDMKIRIPDISKIKKYIGYKPKNSLNKILQSLIAYHKNILSKS